MSSKQLASETVLTNLSLVFFASAAAITNGGLMIHLKNYYGDLSDSSQVDYNLTGSGTDANASLTGSYGDGVLALNIVTLILNGILFILVLQRWIRTRKVRTKIAKLVVAAVGIVTLAVMFAIGVSGYNIYVQSNFGNILVNSGFGDACTTTSCGALEGAVGANILGINGTMIALSGFALLFHGGVAMKELDVIKKVPIVGKSLDRGINSVLGTTRSLGSRYR